MGHYLKTLDLVKKKINDKNIEKVFFLSGKNTFNKTGAKKIFESISEEKKKFL